MPDEAAENAEGVVAASSNETWMEDVTDGEGVSVKNYNISSSPNDFNFLTLMSFMDTGAIVIPHYQRNYTWDLKRASKLVESMIIGLPVPQLFFYEESRNTFAVLDGQQRLMSLYFFWKNRFPRKDKRSELRDIFSEKKFFPAEVLADDSYFSSFSLSLPASQEEGQSAFHGLNYDTLADQQSDLNLRTIRSITIKQNDPDPEGDGHSAVYEIFDRLNTGGVNLKPQEIRSNIYFSKFYEALYEVNKLASWRKLIGQEQRDINLRDVELLLRLSAMLTFSSKYSPSMTRFLNRFSAVAKRRFDDDKNKLIKSLLEDFILKAEKIKEFSPGGRFSVGLTEAVFYAAYKDAWMSDGKEQPKSFQPEQVKSVYDKIRPNLKEGSSKTEYVRTRLDGAVEVIK